MKKLLILSPVYEFKPKKPALIKFPINNDFYIAEYDSLLLNGVSIRDQIENKIQTEIANGTSIYSPDNLNYYVKYPKYVLVYETNENIHTKTACALLKSCFLAIRVLTNVKSGLEVSFIIRSGKLYAFKETSKVYYLPRSQAQYFDENTLPRINDFLRMSLKAMSLNPSRITSAIRSLNHSHHACFDIEKIIYQSTCLESFFSDEWFGVTEKLKKRSAWFIGTNEKTREEIYDFVGKLYNLRSTFVHGKLHEYEPNKTPQKNLQLLYRGEDLIRDILLKIFGNSNLLNIFCDKKGSKLQKHLKSITLPVPKSK